MSFLSGIRRRLRLLRFQYGRFTFHFGNVIRSVGSVLDILSVVASAVCLMSLVVYFGYDHQHRTLQRLMMVIRGCQIVFIVTVLYGIILQLRATIRNSHFVKWLVDTGVLISLLALVYPEPVRPWIPWLGHVMYSHAFLFGVLTAYAVVDLGIALARLTARRTNPSLLMTGSFVFFILAGSFVLMLPKCTLHPISYVDSLFVSTSAVCITGLTSVDIPSTFTPAGMAVLAVLMQIGGLGVLTFTCFFALFFSGTSSVYNQLLIRDLIYSKTMNALMPTLMYILGFTLVIELIGAVGVYLTMPEELGLTQNERIFYSAFHSLSSFCNAGFSPLPQGMANPALMTPGQGLFLVTSLLIFAGAAGFPILVNLRDGLFARMRRFWLRLRRRRNDVPLHLFDLNTKLVLVTTTLILVVSTVLFFICEYSNTLRGMTLWQKVSQSLFNSLTPRSAGFVSVSPADFLNITLLLVVVQMFIGGASQSLGGGIKVNTVAAVFLNVRSILTGSKRAWAYDRALSIGSVRRANAVVALSLTAFIVFMAIELILEPRIGLKPLIFEVTSALFTVGSSMGITEGLCDGSKIALSVAMLVGRVGIISLLAGLVGTRRDFSSHYPEESIIIS